MNTGFLSGEDWEELRRRHNSAYHFLLRRSLVRERMHLEWLGPMRSPHQEQRLSELAACDIENRVPEQVA